MQNPFVSSKKIFSTYLVFWVLVFLVSTVVLKVVLKVDFNTALLDSGIYVALYLVLGISLWYTANFNSLENYSTLKIFLNHIAAAIITSILWVAAGYLILLYFFGDEKSYNNFLNNSLLWRFLIGILFYTAIVSVDYVIIYYTNFQEKLLKEAELNALVKDAELRSLKYQINPHFIFNSLNSISSLTLSNPSRAQEMTIKLSSFLRGTLSKNEKQKNKLSEEINNAKLYLEIEKIRFEDKLDFIEEIEEECGGIEVPNMILQPLFENAVKHGVYESTEKINIVLRCKHENEYIRITVENNFDPDAIPKKGAGIGIKNIQNRLKLIYNQDNLVKVEKNSTVFKVNIFIPVQKVQNEG